MVIALDPRPDTGSWEYVLRDDRENPPEEQAVWILRGLSVTEWASVTDLLNQTQLVALMAASKGDVPDDLDRAGACSVAVAVARRGIVEVRNFKDSAGNPVAVERGPSGKVTEAFLQRLSMLNILELGTEIETRTTLSKADVEKPEPSPED